MDYTTILSMIANLILGGGLITTIATLRGNKRRVNAEADSADIDNIKKAIDIWKDAAEQMRHEVESANREMYAVLSEVAVLRKSIYDIRRIISCGTDAYEQIEQIKKTLNNE